MNVGVCCDGAVQSEGDLPGVVLGWAGRPAESN